MITTFPILVHQQRWELLLLPSSTRKIRDVIPHSQGKILGDLCGKITGLTCFFYSTTLYTHIHKGTDHLSGFYHKGMHEFFCFHGHEVRSSHTHSVRSLPFPLLVLCSREVPSFNTGTFVDSLGLLQLLHLALTSYTMAKTVMIPQCFYHKLATGVSSFSSSVWHWLLPSLWKL